MSLEILQKSLKFNYMKFVEIFNHKKFTFISIFLFLYVIFNFLEGERGLISYYEKQKVKEQKQLSKKIIYVEHKVNLLSENIDLDYLETLYRQKFLVGKVNEKIYVNINESKTSRKN